MDNDIVVDLSFHQCYAFDVDLNLNLNYDFDVENSWGKIL